MVTRKKKTLIDSAIEAEEEISYDELEEFAQDFRSCIVCGGEGESLGVLGKKHHFRCRSCGMTFSRDIK